MEGVVRRKETCAVQMNEWNGGTLGEKRYEQQRLPCFAEKKRSP